MNKIDNTMQVAKGITDALIALIERMKEDGTPVTTAALVGSMAILSHEIVQKMLEDKE